MARVVAKRLLGSKKRKLKSKSKSRGVKIKLKVKASSPEAMGKAVSKLAGTINEKSVG